MQNRIFISVAACTLLTLGNIAGAQPAAGTSGAITVPFSDPSRPGTVKVSVFNGSIEVRAGSGRDVIVTPGEGRDRDDDRERERERQRQRNRGGAAPDPSSGLRRLTQPAGVTIEEENNTVTVNAPMMSGSTRVLVQVPAATSLVLRSVNGGEVSVQGVSGNIEVNNVNGDIRLTDVSGAVIAHATNGEVTATLRQLPAGKPMSFTSFNGDVNVTLPASLKANLKMRSDRGDVYTDFDVRTVPAPPPTPGDTRRDDRNRARADRDNAKYRIEMDRSIYGTVNGGGPDFELRTFNGDIYLRKAN
jgi:hypothetical protein